MFLIEGSLYWSASDLTAAAECEYALLRTLDYKLGWVDPIETKEDPLQKHIATLGDRHEERLLDRFEADGLTAVLGHVEPPYTMAKLEAAGDATFKAFQAEPEVVYQAAFFDGEFFGYADFVERADDGWLVCDAKLARQAKPRALLQLGAYAEQIRKQGFRCPRPSRCCWVTVSAPTSRSPTFCRSLWSVVSVCASCSPRTVLGGTRSDGVPTVVACGKCARVQARCRAEQRRDPGCRPPHGAASQAAHGRPRDDR